VNFFVKLSPISRYNIAPLDNMGQKITKNTCVDLYDLPEDVYQELTSDTYTVIHTAGWEQTGWRILTKAHEECPSGSREAYWEGSLAWPEKGDTVKWRVHMAFDGENSEEETKKHACGWRVNSPDRRTFWPTRLSDNPEAKAAWWLRIDKLLNGLESFEKKKEVKKIEEDMAAAFEQLGKECEESRLTGYTGDVGYTGPAHVTGFTGYLPPVYPPIEPVSRAGGELMEQFRAITRAIPDSELCPKQMIMDNPDVQNYLPLPEGKNLGHLLMELEAISVDDANRVRRLLDCACNKALVTNLCQMTDSAARDQIIQREEAKLYLEPLRKSVTRY